MNTTLRKICDLLRGPGPDRQRAAALVLAEIAPHDAGVVRALCDAIDPAARPLTLACVEALGRIRSPGAVPALLGLIESADDEIREVATHALIGIGSGAVRPISRQIADAPPATRRALLGVLGGVKSAESIRALLSLVQSGHPEASAEAADAIVALSATQNRSEKAKLRGLLEKCLRVPPDKAPDGSLRAALRAIPAVAIPSTTTMLLRMAGPKYPEEVRRDALLSLARVIGGGPMPLRLFEGIYPLLHDGPSPVLRSTALEVIGAVTLPASAGPSLLKLLDNPDPAVRRLVSEGTRPRLPWGPRLRGPLGTDPGLVVGHLRALRGDPDEVVRRSVANHLGDLLKVDRELALGLAREWADDPREEVRRVVRHGVRAALKAGDPEAFALVGAAVAPGELDVSAVEVLTPEVAVPGGELRFRARIRNVASEPLEVVLHYVLREPRARGEGERVVALSSRRLAPGAVVDVGRTHVYRPTTIRTDRPGEAAVALQCSGVRGPFSPFRLVAAPAPRPGDGGQA